MLDYFVIFDSNGIIHYENGKKPGYINQFIEKMPLTGFKGKQQIRDSYIFFELRLPKIYIGVSKFEDPKLLDLEIAKNEEKIATENISNKNHDTIDASDNTEPLTIFEPISKIEIHKSSISKKMFSLFSREANVTDVIKKMSTFLINKNVEPSTAETICKSIQYELNGIEKITENEFKERLKRVLQRILRGIDHEKFIKEISDQKSTGKKVFKICFVGVNGVGKTTSLAKICCWLLQEDLNVYIAACDTFRAGAVEQLKTHVNRFKKANYNVGFYEKGYDKDDSSVCKLAIADATNNNFDVILIDTAGRMHVKKNLMESLTKLIKLNKPDHIVFVGEALIGSDSLDHLKEFNKALGLAGRKIDSIFLTKMDTVDDKIGQIVNMTIQADAPIIFMGMGQRNVDLMKLDVEMIVELLTSK